MGRIVTFAKMAGAKNHDGVSVAPITQGETKDMAAEHIRIEPGKKWSDSAPHGSDVYLFTLNAGATLSAGGKQHKLPVQTFATLEEGVAYSVENTGQTPIEIVKTIAPPKAGKLKGFKGTAAVAPRETTAILDVPEEKKKRIIFVGHHAAESERAHAMIVVYAKDTQTNLHHHPNAESMFVLLDGAVEFTVNGKQEVVRPGQAVYFGANDVHSLHTAPGHTAASFLEFHIPAAYSTVKLAKT